MLRLPIFYKIGLVDSILKRRVIYLTDTDNKSFWNKWAKRYDFAMSADRKTYEHVIIQMKKCLTRDMTVLELACGTGLLSVQLAGSISY